MEVGGYTWYGRNRQDCKRASGGVGLLVKKSLKVFPLTYRQKGLFGLKLG